MNPNVYKSIKNEKYKTLIIHTTKGKQEWATANL